MESLAILALVEAKPGKEKDVETFLKSALPLARAEAKTVRWYAFKLGPSTFGIFDTFADEGDERRTSAARSPRRSWPRRMSYSPNRRRFSSLRSSPRSRARRRRGTRRASGNSNGGRGIRTPKSLRTPVFKTGALAILPALPPARNLSDSSHDG